MEMLAVLIVLVLMIFPLFIFYWSTTRKARNAILLIGLSGSGKTAIFLNLKFKKYFETFTSMKENVEDYQINKRTYKMIDVPGEKRIRSQVFDKHKDQSKGIIFVIDSTTVQDRILDVAEFLLSVLNDKLMYDIRPQIVIVCNKREEKDSKNKSEIEELLKTELSKVEHTKEKQLDSMGGQDKNRIKKSDYFAHYKIKLIEATATAVAVAKSETNTNLTQLNEWLLANF